MPELAEVRRLSHRERLSKAGIARQLGVSLNTVDRLLGLSEIAGIRAAADASEVASGASRANPGRDLRGCPSPPSDRETPSHRPCPFRHHRTLALPAQPGRRAVARHYVAIPRAFRGRVRKRR